MSAQPGLAAAPDAAAGGRAELSAREVAALAAWVERTAGLVFEEGRRAGLS